MSDLAKYLLKQAKTELRAGNFAAAELLVKRARRHDKSGLTPAKQMDQFRFELIMEDPDWFRRMYLR